MQKEIPQVISSRLSELFENPISMMEKEHANAGDAFFRIKELTENYSIPDDACATLTVFYKELNEFEKMICICIYI